MRDFLRKQYDKGELESQLGGQRLVLTAHEMILETDFQTSATPWYAVEKIEVMQSHAYFFFNPLFEAYLLPIHAFGSRAEFAAFMEAAHTLKEAAGQRETTAVRPEDAVSGEVVRQPGGVFEVAYKITPEDRLAAMGISRATARWQLFVILMVSGIVMMVSAIMLGFSAYKDAALRVPYLLLLVPIFGVALMWLFPKNPLALRIIKKSMAKHLRYFYEAIHRLRLTPDSLIQAVGDQLTARPWKSVEAIVTTADHAFFRIGRAEVLMLPKRPSRRKRNSPNLWKQRTSTGKHSAYLPHPFRKSRASLRVE